MRVMFPPLSNQYILMTLGTSMASVFGVEELTGPHLQPRVRKRSVSRGVLASLRSCTS